MAKICKPLSDTQIKNSKKGPKKLFDGGGLFLFVSQSGSKIWRMSYEINGRETTTTFGNYPIISLKQAREKREEIKILLSQRIDPKREMEAQKAQELTFEHIANEWFGKNEPVWAKGYSEDVKARLEKHVYPYLGNSLFNTLRAKDLLAVLNRLEKQNKIETAHRTSQQFSQIYRYAIIHGYAEYNIADNLKGALTKNKVKHFASITDVKEVGGLLRAIDTYTGTYWITVALKLSPYVFVRPTELRCAEWEEFNFKKKEWVIPPARMKMKQKHIVPLSDQALEIIYDLKSITHSERYLFPSLRTTARPMSNNTINAALRRLGCSKDDMTGHGFRSMASTLLNEQGVNSDWIERQLAHSERNKVRAAYNYAQFLPERRKMMQCWANFLDELRNGNYEAQIHIS